MAPDITLQRLGGEMLPCAIFNKHQID